MTELGFDILPGDHPIVPVMIGDAALAGAAGRGAACAAASTPSASPSRSCRRDQARIRTQMSAAHTLDDLDFAVEQFVGRPATR